MHYIQRYILDKLVYDTVLRNRDMRPPQVESNLYQYHLLQLQREGYIQKRENGYTLTGRGLAYADRHSTTLKKTRTQPKLITVLFVTNDEDKILLVPKARQPFKDTMNFPSGKIHLDESVEDAARRELQEKIHHDVVVDSLEHFGVAHMTIRQEDFVISDYIALLMHARVTTSTLPEGAYYYSPDDIFSQSLMPSVAELLDAFLNKRQFTESHIEIV